MMRRNSKGIIGLLILIIVILLVLCVLFATGIIDLKSNNVSTIDKEELTSFGESDYNIIKDVYNSDYSFKLDIDGRININFENYISNISNVEDILLFNSLEGDSILYILTSDGSVYMYETSNYQSGKYDAVKIDEYSDYHLFVSHLINGEQRKANLELFNEIIKDIQKDNPYLKDTLDILNYVKNNCLYMVSGFENISKLDDNEILMLINNMDSVKLIEGKDGYSKKKVRI